MIPHDFPSTHYKHATLFNKVAFPNGLFPFWVVIGLGVFGFFLFFNFFFVFFFWGGGVRGVGWEGFRV